jgi:hypothetical protein
MAVYTDVSAEDLGDFAGHGPGESYKGIAEGVRPNFWSTPAPATTS